MPRPRTYDRDQALQDAMEAFWASGYAATSVRALQRATGMVPNSLYAEFGGKDALFALAVGRYIEESRAWYARSLGDDEGPASTRADGGTGSAPGTASAPAAGLPALRAHFGSYTFDVRASEGCLLVNSLGERSTIPPRARELIDDFFEWTRLRFRHHLEVADRSGALPPGADPDALATALLAFDQGLASAATIPEQRRRLRSAVGSWFDALEAASS